MSVTLDRIQDWDDRYAAAKGLSTDAKIRPTCLEESKSLCHHVQYQYPQEGHWNARRAEVMLCELNKDGSAGANEGNDWSEHNNDRKADKDSNEKEWDRRLSIRGNRERNGDANVEASVTGENKKTGTKFDMKSKVYPDGNFSVSGGVEFPF